MNELSKRRCIPCERGSAPLMHSDAERLIAEVPEWAIAMNGKSIHREFKFKDFKGAFAFVCEVADIAEFEGHHPDIELSWGRVKITLTTHALKGLSENDFIMAAKFDRIEIPLDR